MKTRTRYFYTLKVIELDYAKDYHAHVEFETYEHGLRCEISLADNEDDSELVIGTITTKDGSMEECQNYAISMLSDEDYCSSVWQEHTKRRNKRKCAAH